MNHGYVNGSSQLWDSAGYVKGAMTFNGNCAEAMHFPHHHTATLVDRTPARRARIGRTAHIPCAKALGLTPRPEHAASLPPAQHPSQAIIASGTDSRASTLLSRMVPRCLRLLAPSLLTAATRCAFI